MDRRFDRASRYMVKRFYTDSIQWVGNVESSSNSEPDSVYHFVSHIQEKLMTAARCHLTKLRQLQQSHRSLG